MTEGIILAVIAILLSSIGQILLKAGTTSGLRSIVAGYCCFAAATLLSLLALRIVPLSLYTSWAASTYIVVGIFSRIFLNERLTPRQWCGLLGVFAGIIIFSLG